VEACPHCGATLPTVVDAFCPECRAALDEQPVRPTGDGEAADGAGPASGRRVGWPKGATALGAAVGVLWAFTRSGAAGAGPAFEAGFLCGGGVIGGVVGALAGLIWTAGRAGRS
jgi:hypothetical protein